MPSIDHDNKTGVQYWRSLDELADSPQFREFLECEFPGHAAEVLRGPNRRQFLKIMAASMALAGVATLPGCRRWPEEKLAPHHRRPEGTMPGEAEYYASHFELGGYARPVMIKTIDGRPIKIEGNSGHPMYTPLREEQPFFIAPDGKLPRFLTEAQRESMKYGPSDAITQAAVLEMYDPERSRGVQQGDGKTLTDSTWDKFESWAKKHFADLRKKQGEGLAIVCEMTSSPTLARLRDELMKACPKANWVTYEPIGGAKRLPKAEGGGAYETHVKLTGADVIVSLDADCLMTHPDAVVLTRQFARRRREVDSADGEKMNRLYVAESSFSVTGSNADERFVTSSGGIAQLAAQISAGVGGRRLTEEPAFVQRVVKDLLAHEGRSVVVAGPHQPAEVHLLCARINQELGNIGRTVWYRKVSDPLGVSDLDGLVELADAMRGGKINTLVVLGGNPAFDAPADAEFAAAMEKVGHRVHLAGYEDETSKRSTWHVNRAHWLETWGDSRTFDGTYGIGQPTIKPLYEGKSPIELLGLIVRGERVDAYEEIRKTFVVATGATTFSERAWRRALHDGYAPDTAFRPSQAAIHGRRARAKHESPEGMEVVFKPAYGVYDGRFANNGWLQEAPEPLTKLTWDNAALIAPRKAKELGVTQGDMIEIEANRRKLEAPVFLMWGQAVNTITLALGYGRESAGHVGNGVGVNAYKLRTSDAMGIATGVKVRKLDRKHKLVSTQDHHVTDQLAIETTNERLDKYYVLETSVDHYEKNRTLEAFHPAHAPPKLPMFHQRQKNADDPDIEANQWAMTIDLTSCTGCGACTVACQAENNIPVVGKVQVDMGREMHWIRIDRYYKGDPMAEDVAVRHQPVTCMHCETAPCEQVCPVAATVHDSEGLNVQVYNRCVGTRYCSNNCPYKVRRFNYFDYHVHDPRGGNDQMPHLGAPDAQQERIDQVRRMGFNPDVTVRMRGVMEKCTFCTQRIQAAKIHANNEQSQGKRDSHLVQDGEVLTACQQACPAEAIVFGDMTDPDSRIHEVLKRNDGVKGRAYGLIDAQLDTQPRVKYLAKVTNPPASVSKAHEREGGDH